MLDLHAVILEDLEHIVSQPVSWDKLQGKTVLVTGASGMIASYLVFTLLYLNDTRHLNILVLALVRNGEKAKQQFGNILVRSDITLLIQDVSQVLDYSGPVDYIVHAASQASPRFFTTDPVGTIQANTMGTENMLRTAMELKSEGFLYLSTREIYGKFDADKSSISEEEYGVLDPTVVRSCYPESKRMAEAICRAYAHQYGVPVRVARIAHTYGPDWVMDNGRVWGDFISNVVRGENIVLKSQGTMELAFTYISDMVAGLFLVLLNGKEFVYNLSTDKSTTVRKLAELLAELYPEKGIRVVIDIPKDTSAYLANPVPKLDCSRIVSLGWKPTITLKAGFQRTIAYQESTHKGG